MEEELIRKKDVIELLWYFTDECCGAVIQDFEAIPTIALLIEESTVSLIRKEN